VLIALTTTTCITSISCSQRLLVLLFWKNTKLHKNSRVKAARGYKSVVIARSEQWRQNNKTKLNVYSKLAVTHIQRYSTAFQSHTLTPKHVSPTYRIPNFLFLWKMCKKSFFLCQKCLYKKLLKKINWQPYWITHHACASLIRAKRLLGIVLFPSGHSEGKKDDDIVKIIRRYLSHPLRYEFLTRWTQRIIYFRSKNPFISLILLFRRVQVS